LLWGLTLLLSWLFIVAMSRMIKEDVLRAIDEALKIHAPHLVHSLHKIMRSGLAEAPSHASGASIYATLTASTPWADGEQILKALEAIEKAHGYIELFAGRQINWLVQCWKQFSEPRQLPTQP
jgi:hypothetical protein